MSSLTFRQATDDIFKLVYDAWQTTGHPIKFPNKVFSEPNPPSPWAWVTLEHFAGGQRGFGSSRRMFERRGSLIVRVMVPIGDGLSLGYDLAKVISDAVEGSKTDNGVWFRNTRIQEGDGPENYEIVSFRAIFVYHELK